MLGRSSTQTLDDAFTDEQLRHLRDAFTAHGADGAISSAEVGAMLLHAGLGEIATPAEELSAVVSFDEFALLVRRLVARSNEDESFMNKHGSLNSNVSLEPLSSSSSDEADDEDPAVIAATKRAAEELARQRMVAAQAGVEGDLERLALQNQSPPGGRTSGRKASFDYGSAGRRLSTDL